jgi:hypothetical protein
MQTKQQIAIAVAQQLSAYLIQLKQLDENLQDLNNQYNEEGLSNVWAAMPTAAVNADGTVGAADGSPVASNPTAVGGINKSKNALVNGIVLAQQLHGFLTNAAVIQGNYLQSINDLL